MRSISTLFFVFLSFRCSSWVPTVNCEPTTTTTTTNLNEDDSEPFELRHFHAVEPDSGRILWADVYPEEEYTIESTRIKVYKSSSSSKSSKSSSLLYDHQMVMPLWEEEEIYAPNVSSRETLLQLAKMTNNAYATPGDDRWYDLGERWNTSHQIGWHPHSDGFRGHVFATPSNRTVVLSIKGTSIAGLFSSGPTVHKDKLNDNLLFSCCCARVDWTWSTVCGCYEGGWKCGQNCLEREMVERGRGLFYPVGIELYNNLTYLYPRSNIWVIGHSLGGSLASLIGATFGTPVVTFEAPGEKMAASRLHLPSPPSLHHITHVYHTADPIAMGTCNGILSSCALGGYAMESKCHLGKRIVYDTVSNLSWATDIRTHPIGVIIEKLLSEPWAPSIEIGREVPESEVEEDCVECYRWDFNDG